MIGEIIGAIAGKNISKHVDGVGGAGGALLGAGAAAALRRFGPIALIATSAGGYALKKYPERRHDGPHR